MESREKSKRWLRSSLTSSSSFSSSLALRIFFYLINLEGGGLGVSWLMQASTSTT
jgi:hypothetical protein